MDNTTELSVSWDAVLADSMQQVYLSIVSFLPQLFSALMLLLAGVVVAWLLSKLTLSLLVFARQTSKKLMPPVLQNKLFSISTAQLNVVSKIVFWIVILFFVATSSKLLGLDFFASTISDLIIYLPRLLAGALIILGGYLLSNLAAAMTRAALESSGMGRVQTMSTVVKVSVMFTTIVVGVEQIGVDMRFVTNIAITLGGVLTGGIALAFGLGCRSLISNTVGARQVRKHCQLRHTIALAGVEGTLVDITGTMLVIENAQGKTLIPARLFLQGPTQIMMQPSTPAESSEAR